MLVKIVLVKPRVSNRLRKKDKVSPNDLVKIPSICKNLVVKTSSVWQKHYRELQVLPSLPLWQYSKNVCNEVKQT
jgi:hypothetical protein